MVSKQVVYAFSWVSWSAIIAGGVAAVAVSILMAVIGVALGFTVVDPRSDEPVSKLGTVFSIWSAISVVVSMAAGGFVAGLAAGQRGLEHGFLVWALVVIGATCFSSIAVGAAVRTIGAAVRSMGAGAAGVAAGVASTLGKEAGHAVSGVIDEVRQNVHLHLDSSQLSEEVLSTLRDTGVEALQPEYLHNQLKEAGSDLRGSIRRIALNPSDAEQIISRFMEAEQTRLESLAKGMDREAAVTALMNVRGLPRSEAETLVDNVLKAYAKIVEKAKAALAEAGKEVGEARDYLKELARQAREKADDLSKGAAKAALGAALTLIVAAASGMIAGLWGVSCSVVMYAVQGVGILN